MSAQRPWWRPVLGLAAFFLLLGPSRLAFVALPLAGLLWLARPQQGRTVFLASILAGTSLAWLARVGGSTDQVLRAWVLLSGVGLVGAAMLSPGRFLSRGAAASTLAGVATFTLMFTVGPSWSEVAWAVQYETNRVLHEGALMLSMSGPDTFTTLDRVAAAMGRLYPSGLWMQSLLGGALAWSIAHRLSPGAQGEPLGRFRDFTFSDHVVWALMLGMIAMVAPFGNAVRTLAVNLTVVLTALYMVRGVAVSVALLERWGIPVIAMVGVTVAATLLAVPLLVILPSTLLLGIADTWIDVRGRLRTQATG